MSVSNEYDYVKKRLQMLERIEAKNQAKIRYNQKSLERIEHIRSLKEDNSQEVINALFRKNKWLKREKKRKKK